MKVSLVSHINGDGDILEAWFKYYLRVGVSSFHLIVHGPRDQNSTLYRLKDNYPIAIEDSYESMFDSREKKDRLDFLLNRMRGRWILIADSDEFVEFPYQSMGRTVRVLQLVRRTALAAPMLQHVCADGSMNTPSQIDDPFSVMPLCSIDLYARMGVDAYIGKYPLLYCTDKTVLADGGNHYRPAANRESSLLGVTHHFKFRSSVYGRLSARIDSTHPWRAESVGFRSFLVSNDGKLPTEGSFLYSREELFRRGLLRRFTARSGISYLRNKTNRI